jgi:hypothetical protein
MCDDEEDLMRLDTPYHSIWNGDWISMCQASSSKIKQCQQCTTSKAQSEAICCALAHVHSNVTLHGTHEKWNT